MLLHLTQLLSVITDITARPLHLPYVGTQGSPINSPRTSPQGRSLVGGCHNTTPWGWIVRPFGAVFWVALTGTWPWVWKRTIFTLTVVFVMLCGNKITFLLPSDQDYYCSIVWYFHKITFLVPFAGFSEKRRYIGRLVLDPVKW